MPFVSHRALGCPPLSIDSSWGLRTIPQGTAYSTCKSLHCQECGHLFVDYRFDDLEMQRLYADYRGADYTKLRELYEPGYASRNAMLCEGASYKIAVESFLAPMLPPGSLSILDWGGDTGVNTPFEARRHCLDIYDPSAKTLQHGTPIKDLVATNNRTYDLIVLSEVLEHIPFPVKTIRTILPIIAEKTLLYIEFPFERIQRSWDGRSNLAPMKRHWHEHINFFSLQSSLKLFAKCGLEVVGQQTLALSDDLRPAADGKNHIFMFALRMHRV